MLNQEVSPPTGLLDHDICWLFIKTAGATLSSKVARGCSETMFLGMNRYFKSEVELPELDYLDL